MLELVLIIAGVGVVIGAASAYGVTHREVHQIHFCDSDDLQKELERFKIRIAGNDHCLVCNDEIHPDNVGMVVSRNDKFFEVCSKSKCMNTYDMVPIET